MTKKDYYEKYKEHNIKKYTKYALNQYKETLFAFFGSIGVFFSSLFIIILFPFVFIYHIIRRYYLRRKTWKRYVKGDESVLELIKE